MVTTMQQDPNWSGWRCDKNQYEYQYECELDGIIINVHIDKKIKKWIVSENGIAHSRSCDNTSYIAVAKFLLFYRKTRFISVDLICTIIREMNPEGSDYYIGQSYFEQHKNEGDQFLQNNPIHVQNTPKKEKKMSTEPLNVWEREEETEHFYESYVCYKTDCLKSEIEEHFRVSRVASKTWQIFLDDICCENPIVSAYDPLKAIIKFSKENSNFFKKNYLPVENSDFYKNLAKLIQQTTEVSSSIKDEKNITEKKDAVETKTTTVAPKKEKKMDQFFKMMMLSQMFNGSNKATDNGNPFNMNMFANNPMIMMMLMGDDKEDKDSLFGNMSIEDMMMKGFDPQEMLIRNYAKKKNISVNEEAIHLVKDNKLKIPNDFQAIVRIYLSDLTVPQLLKLYGKEEFKNTSTDVVEDLEASLNKKKK